MKKNALPKLDSVGVATHIEGYINNLAKQANLDRSRLGFAQRIETTRGAGSARILSVSLDKISLCEFTIPHSLSITNTVGIGQVSFSDQEILAKVNEGMQKLEK